MEINELNTHCKKNFKLNINKAQENDKVKQKLIQ